jgi:hypothetical protein
MQRLPIARFGGQPPQQLDIGLALVLEVPEVSSGSALR